MKIDISHISKVDGASIDLDFSEKMPELDGVVSDIEFTAPVKFKGRLTNISGIIKLDGCAEVDISSKCCRCLKDLNTQMSINIKEDFLSSDKSADEDSYTYEGNYVSIDKALKDNIVLNLPVRQLCSDECKGLCSICGNDLNTMRCDCKEDRINPQMEALKNFF